MATILDISLSAYTKLENQKTKLTVDRLIQIATILDMPLQELLEIKSDKFYKQKLYDSSIIYQEINTLNQNGKEHLNQLLSHIKEENKHLKEEISFLRTLIESNNK